MGITTAANSLFLLVSRCIVCAHARKSDVEFFSTLCEQVCGTFTSALVRICPSIKTKQSLSSLSLINEWGNQACVNHEVAIKAKLGQSKQVNYTQDSYFFTREKEVLS